MGIVSNYACSGACHENAHYIEPDSPCTHDWFSTDSRTAINYRQRHALTPGAAGQTPDLGAAGQALDAIKIDGQIPAWAGDWACQAGLLRTQAAVPADQHAVWAAQLAGLRMSAGVMELSPACLGLLDDFSGKLSHESKLSPPQLIHDLMQLPLDSGSRRLLTLRQQALDNDVRGSVDHSALALALSEAQTAFSQNRYDDAQAVLMHGWIALTTIFQRSTWWPGGTCWY